MCLASQLPGYFFFDALTVTVFVDVLAVPPVGVNLIVSFTERLLFFLRAFMAFDESEIVTVWAPAFVTVTFLAVSFTLAPFFGLAVPLTTS
jgi:hypothetical protein